MVSHLSFENISKKRFLFAFWLCVFIIIIAYRIQLAVGLYKSPIRPFDFYPNSSPLRFIVTYLIYDFLLLFFCISITYLISKIKNLLYKDDSKFLNISGAVFLSIIIILILLIHGAHIRLLFNAQIGFDYSILVETFLNVPFKEIIRLFNINDYLYLLIPISIFWIIGLSPITIRRWLLKISLPFLILLFSISLLYFYNEKEKAPNEIRSNPAIFISSDIVKQEILNLKNKDRKIIFIKEEGEKFNTRGFHFKGNSKQIKILPPKLDHPWNIIIFIMESVGSRYMFDTSLGNPIAMPFLKRLSKESWYLKRHFTTSNISTKAIFSILSGRYDLFKKEAFGVRIDARIPSIYNFLDKNYESFIVTPSPIRWYFPTEFVKNSGFNEIYHFDNLPFKIREELHTFGRYIGRDEIETVKFFIKRIEKAKEPFLAIYLSFSAHLPYFDYGPEYRILENDGRLISRYYNNLFLLDNMIRNIFEHLERSGLLEKTILVIVGDHGQAFGQHQKDNYMHHRYSYNENLETPAIIYQPKIFNPKSFEYPTSHVDILPTILDAIGAKFDPSLLDGESLFNVPLNRKFIFFYGQEGTISCLDTNLVKLQYSLKNNRCWVFDLKSDPEEKNPMDCSLFNDQLETLKYFVDHHNSSLLEYNSSRSKDMDYDVRKNPF